MRGSNEGWAGEASGFVHAEGNLELLPVFLVGGRSKDTSPYSLEWVVSTPDGTQMRKSWTVEPHAQYGAPRGRDQDVFVAVLTLLERRGGMPEDGVVSTSRAELLRTLGWPNNGKHYRQLRECLTRIDRTIIASREAFYHRDTESWFDGSFRIWGVQFLASRRRSDGRTEEIVVIRFGDVVIRSFVATYLKGLDTELYWSLRSHLSKRLYRLVDQMRGRRVEWEEGIFKLQELIPLGPYRYPSQIVQKLKPAHAELVDRGFLEDVDVDQRARKVCYRVTGEFVRRREAFEAAESSEGFTAMEMMAAVGVGSTEARKLVRECGVERCLACAQALPFQKSIRKGPLAWFRWAVKAEEFDPYPYLRGEESSSKQAWSANAESLGGRCAAQRSEARIEPELPTPDADPELRELWDSVLEDVSQEINSPSLKVWFEGTVPVGLDVGKLILEVPNSFAEEYIEKRFKGMLVEALRQRIGEDAGIEVVSREEDRRRVGSEE